MNDVKYQEFPLTELKIGIDIPNFTNITSVLDISSPYVSTDDNLITREQEEVYENFNNGITTFLGFNEIIESNSIHTTLASAVFTTTNYHEFVDYVEFIYSKPFVLYDEIIDVSDDFNGVGIASYYHTIDRVVVSLTMLEYKYIDNEYKIVPIYEEIELTPSAVTMVNNVWEYLNNKYKKEKFVIREMSIMYDLTFNGKSQSNEDKFMIVYQNKYYNYDNYITKPNWLNELNNQATIVPIEYDYTSWIITAVGGFMAFEIIPGFSIGGIFSVVIMIALLGYILKMFLGG